MNLITKKNHRLRFRETRETAGGRGSFKTISFLFFPEENARIRPISVNFFTPILRSFAKVSISTIKSKQIMLKTKIKQTVLSLIDKDRVLKKQIIKEIVQNPSLPSSIS